MKSSLKNMVLMLFVIALVCSGAVAMVYKMTEEPIRQAKIQKDREALQLVLPAFDSLAEAQEVGGCVVTEAYVGQEVVGYAVKSSSPNGFNGAIDLMVGFLPDGTINNIEVLAQAETPGLGANMTAKDNALLGSFKSKDASKMKMTVRKDGGDVDALTAATISSRAYTEAVALAYEAFKSVSAEAEEVFDPAEVMPAHDDMFTSEIDGATVHTATLEGHAVGYGIEASSTKGFNGLVRLFVVFDTEGVIYDIVVLEQNETPGLGSKMCEPNNALIKSLKGKKAGRIKLALRGEGGSVDAISSATISSRAYTEAVAEAWQVFKKINL